MDPTFLLRRDLFASLYRFFLRDAGYPPAIAKIEARHVAQALMVPARPGR